MDDVCVLLTCSCILIPSQCTGTSFSLTLDFYYYVGKVLCAMWCWLMEKNMDLR